MVAARRRRGIVLPAVLAVMVAMAALSALALFDSLQESRVAALARDRVIARAAALEGIALLAAPTDLLLLCLRPPVAEQVARRTSAGGGAVLVRWRHLGGGRVLGEVEGEGRSGSRYRLRAHLRADSIEASGGAAGCPRATRLVPAIARWIEPHPEG